MNKKEAIQAMLDGKKVFNTLEVFKNDLCYLCFKDGDFYELFSEEGGETKFINLHKCRDEGWQIYKEPKVKTKFYLFMMGNGDCSKNFYSEGLKTFCKGGGVHDVPWITDKWIRTNTYIEVEI